MTDQHDDLDWTHTLGNPPADLTPLRTLILGCLGALVILGVGVTMGELDGHERGRRQGLAVCEGQVEALGSRLTGLEADLRHLGRFSGFVVTGTTHQPTAGTQTILLVGPDSVLVEVETR